MKDLTQTADFSNALAKIAENDINNLVVKTPKKVTLEENKATESRKSDIRERVLSNDQDDLLKPLKSNNFSGNHTNQPPSSTGLATA